MKKRMLGLSGLEVSAIGFGAIGFSQRKANQRFVEILPFGIPSSVLDSIASPI